jgi:hypothetical protein
MTAGAILLPFVLIVIALVTTAILCYFGNRKDFAWYVQLTALIGYFFPFTIIAILPIDLASTKYRACLKGGGDCNEPLLHVDEAFLYGYWVVVYWITFNMQM